MRKAYDIPDELHARVRMAAACGSERVPKGALERFVIRALRRAVEDPQPGAGLPRLKLCAHCFTVNSERMRVPRTGLAPLAAFETRQSVVEPASTAAPIELFPHLLGDDSGCVAGLMGSQPPVVSSQLPEEPGEGVHFLDLPLHGNPAVLPDRGDPDDDHTCPAVAGGPGVCDCGSAAGSEFERAGFVEVTPSLWVGSDANLNEFNGSPLARARVSLLSAAKEPWHRSMVGYKTKSAPEGPERLVARSGNHMALNLIDVRELGPGGHHYVPDEVIEAAIQFIDERISAGDQVVVHDPKGQSAAPTIALLYMLRKGLISEDAPLPMFVQHYKFTLLAAGMAEYLRVKLSALAAMANGQKNDQKNDRKEEQLSHG